jgi:exopolysaccharide production protein ExoQ
MPTSIAFVFLIIGVGGLFYLDREKNARPSKAVWLPIIWLVINGSRPASVWLGLSSAYDAPGQLPSSSLLDQLIAAVMMLVGGVVMYRRKRILISILKTGWPITLFFAYCLLSVIWSDFPAWGLKRWVREVGELIMVLVIATDPQPMPALRRFFSRVGFLIFPASIFLVKYYPQMGRGYDQWGLQMNVGVTTNKNTLGVVTFVISLGTVWQILKLWREKRSSTRSRRLIAQCVLLLCGLDVLVMAHSATSGASFAFGAGMMAVTTTSLLRKRPAAIHALVVLLLLAGATVALFGGGDEAVKSLGRSTDFTGRTPIWKKLSGMGPNILLGAGFETFWIGPRVIELDHLFPGINEAHNGYIELYLNLGFVGIVLMLLLVAQGYFRAIAIFRRDPTFGCLLAAAVLTALTYNVTEAGFRMLGPAWFFLLLCVILANTPLDLANKHHLGPQHRKLRNQPLIPQLAQRA